MTVLTLECKRKYFRERTKNNPRINVAGAPPPPRLQGWRGKRPCCPPVPWSMVNCLVWFPTGCYNLNRDVALERPTLFFWGGAPHVLGCLNFVCPLHPEISSATTGPHLPQMRFFNFAPDKPRPESGEGAPQSICGPSTSNILDPPLFPLTWCPRLLDCPFCNWPLQYCTDA